MGGELDPALDAARRGEEWGVARLWSELNPPLERYLRALVGQSAQDVASETWLQAARDLPAFRGDAAGARVWLFRMARNRAVDELRRVGRRREELMAEPVEALHPATAPDAAEQAAERLGTVRALALVAALPQDQAEAVLLRVVVGLDAKQSGEILGKRAGAVRVAAMRGLRNLAAALDAEGPETPADADARPADPVEREPRRPGRPMPHAGVGIGMHGARR